MIIPAWLKWIAIALVVGIVLYVPFYFGEQHVQAEWDLSKLADTKAQVTISVNSNLATNSVVGTYTANIQTIYVHGATVKEEVTKYVTVQDDQACRINNGFVWLYNSAVTGKPLPGPAGSADDSGTRLSDLASTLGDFGTAARLNAEQLTQLQAWVRAQVAVYGAPTRSAPSDR